MIGFERYHASPIVAAYVNTRHESQRRNYDLDRFAQHFKSLLEISQALNVKQKNRQTEQREYSTGALAAMASSSSAGASSDQVIIKRLAVILLQRETKQKKKLEYEK
ncbi:hypothetical protein CHARACLAT_001316 [Characodon lateralis]|uniref:Uncharacterized protein n=1 Tax=Characodon lateralis TaxID=208331 RepID=A0ABU7ET74_9TELE|nr:hypothetical protein [Characodon lateralis]